MRGRDVWIEAGTHGRVLEHGRELSRVAEAVAVACTGRWQHVQGGGSIYRVAVACTGQQQHVQGGSGMYRVVAACKGWW